MTTDFTDMMAGKETFRSCHWREIKDHFEDPAMLSDDAWITLVRPHGPNTADVLYDHFVGTQRCFGRFESVVLAKDQPRELPPITMTIGDKALEKAREFASRPASPGGLPNWTYGGDDPPAHYTPDPTPAETWRDRPPLL